MYSPSSAIRAAAHGDLAAVAGMDRELALDEDHGARGGQLEEIVDLLPAHRLDRAGLVGDDEAQEVVAAAPGAALALADGEHGGHRVALAEVADEAADQRHRGRLNLEGCLKRLQLTWIHHLRSK